VTPRLATAIALAMVAAGSAACSGGSSMGTASTTRPPAPSTTTAPAAPALVALHAARGATPAILDADGRQVILRGVNVNSLGDYYQDDPTLPAVVPVTDEDWANVAGHGFDVVRLLVSWSSLEPRRGDFDNGYLARVADAVHAAAAHGIYSVVDMHQDAWGKYIASPPGTHCPTGSAPAIGWDGAPQWATITNGTSTCARGSRENAEAVETAWDSFYADKTGIMSQLVATWSLVATKFAHDPDVAGFDLLNEPNHGHDTNSALAGLARYYGRAIQAIRGAESGAGGLHHVVFFEDTVDGALVAPTFTTDTNIVFAPHNYGESIGDIPIEGEFDYFAAGAKRYATALWIGEYGWFSDPATQEPKLVRYAAKEDALLTAGDAWWQWRQACGDPHSIGHPGGKPDAVLIHFQRNGCPGDHNLGVVPEWQCTWRPYPRAAPGRLTDLKSTCDDSLSFHGNTDAPGPIDVWFPAQGSKPPLTSGGNVDLASIRARAVAGGWRIAANVHGAYSITVSAPQP
jgi:endoglycosylceramidase